MSLPAEALTRLRELEGTGGAAPLFTSDLSVNEFLLVRTPAGPLHRS